MLLNTDGVTGYHGCSDLAHLAHGDALVAHPGIIAKRKTSTGTRW
jgi:hypothetical protein